MAECVNKERNLRDCGCTYPGCLFPPDAEKTYDRSLEYFIEVWSKKLGLK